MSPLNNMGNGSVFWRPDGDSSLAGRDGLAEAVRDVTRPLFVIRQDGEYAAAHDGLMVVGGNSRRDGDLDLAGFAPACRLQELGDPSFCRDYGIKYPYLIGSMANGLSSAEMVEAAAEAGMLGFFGAGGLPVSAIEKAVDRLSSSLAGRPFGFNLIHSPNEPALEAATADLYIKKGIRLIEASAFMDMTLPLVKYRVQGIQQAPDGSIITPNQVLAKASRVEVAAKFFSPPARRFLQELVSSGEITEEQAALAARIPMAQDMTVEADSGGHTDNAPAITLFPTMLSLRDRLQAEHNYEKPLRIGAAGGIATPASAVAAFSMGAAYVLTGSINQAAVESGTSGAVREMLTKTCQADVTMAPAADMFEMGVKVQVLKWGTMFAMRAGKLFDLYRAYDSLEALPPDEKKNLEKNFFKAPLETIWDQTRKYFQERDRAQVDRAGQDPKHRMALVFRWYLGQTSNWANTGEPSRKIDYQIFCGPAMGAFNEWVKGSFLEKPENRNVAVMAMNILYGAAVLTRVSILRRQGVVLPLEAAATPPLRLEKIEELLK